ncbi:MAG: 2,3-bisphosphoglycerate-independent phosphoglycerate mutase [Candidatus Moraniibacteriota bacterium]
MYRPLVLVVLDGWGLSSSTQGNPIREATLPTIDKLNKYYPMTALQASGIAVGLPWNTPGNSEVGHMTIGSGRVIYQNLPRISLAVQDGSFFKNEALVNAMSRVKENGGALHIMGLVGEGSVHSNKDHLYMLLQMAAQNGLTKVFIHAFTDGRDSPPTSGVHTLKEVISRTTMLGVGTLASIGGRNWGMDRNNNWERIERAYRVFTEGAPTTEDFIAYTEASYQKGITDEYIEPVALSQNGKPVGIIQDGDSIIFFNYREDRAREMTKAFSVPDFDNFPRPKKLDVDFVTMTEYERNLPVHVAFAPEKVTNTLGEVLSKHGKIQLRIAETEKYAHVTYFFNGGAEKAWPGEERMLVPSPSVAHFDEIPEMSSAETTSKTIEAVRSGKYDFILLNYASPDMVGHTGNEQASIEAVESTDKCLSLLIPAVLQAGGALLITADHGNVEEIRNLKTGEKDTEHSKNPVPLWFITANNHREKSAEEMVREETQIEGLLSDIAPTILDLMEIEKPEEIHSQSLLHLFQKK